MANEPKTCAHPSCLCQAREGNNYWRRVPTSCASADIRHVLSTPLHELLRLSANKVVSSARCRPRNAARSSQQALISAAGFV